MALEVTNSEIQNELDAMEQNGKHHTPRNVRKAKDKNKKLKIILIIILLCSLLICSFVWVMSIDQNLEKDGYIINVEDKEGFYGKSYALELAYDPTFSDAYKELVGLGYGEVDWLKGGSMFESLGTNTTMFDKFKNFAENEEVASTYEKNEGSANFDQYYCNKYYIRNVSDQVVYYRLNLKITQNIQGALDAARFMFVTGEEGNYQYQILATPNKETNEKEVAASKKVSNATYNGLGYFVNPNLINDQLHTTLNLEEAWLCDKLEINPANGLYQYTSCEVDANGNVTSGEWYMLLPGASTCYTICVWFEGSDPDHSNAIIGGGISFTVSYETEAFVKYMN